MTSFLFLHSAAAVALAIFLGLTGTILSVVAVCKAAALGQRPMNQIVREAEDRRQADRRREDRPLEQHDLGALAKTTADRWIWTCSCGAVCLPRGYTDRDTAFERWAAHARSGAS